MEQVTPEAFTTFLLVAAALIAFTLSVWALVDKMKKARQPYIDLKQWQRDTDNKLKAEQKRLDALERGNVVLLQAISAMLSHEITGNSIDKLKEAQTDLTNYLIKR